MSEKEKTEIVEETPSLFETHSVWTREMLTELQKSAVRPGQCLIFVLLVPILTYSVLCIIDGEWLFLLVVAIWIAAGCCSAYLPYRIAKRQYNQYRVLYNKDIECDLCFREEEITSSNLLTGGKLTINYEKFHKLIKTKNLYLLYMDKKMVIFFHRNDFTVGDAASFEAFITKKKKFK